MKKTYAGRTAAQVAFPLGGTGAGMLCIQGTGAFGSVSLRHAPDLLNEPNMFAALHIKGCGPNARVLEAPVPPFKVFARREAGYNGSGLGLPFRNFGFPRFAGKSEFRSEFPFAEVSLEDENCPLKVSVTGWSPFIPGDEDRSSLPFAAVEYAFLNPTAERVEAVFSFQAVNFMKLDDSAFVEKIDGGFIVRQPGSAEEHWKEGAFCAFVDSRAQVDAAWFRGGWYDAQTMLWNQLEQGETPDRAFDGDGKSAGGSLAVHFAVEPGETVTIPLKFCWYVPRTNLRIGSWDHPDADPDPACYRPWYSVKFPSIEAVRDEAAAQYDALRAESAAFRDALAAITLPDELAEAVEANLTILKSPTVLRQADGRLWGWEGCCETVGSCHGSCTHVWNYAQAFSHLFPRLERSLRQTEFHENQDAEGHQQFRAYLPIRPVLHEFYAAADGQLGGIMKFYRDWKISGDGEFLREYWPLVKQSMEYCIRTWDPDGQGIVKEPHHNTYDIEFWGPDPMCTSFYLGALKAAGRMAAAMGEDPSRYEQLAAKGRAHMEEELFNGEYFEQKVMGGGMHAVLNPENPYPETAALLEKEGPKYQYGSGCLSDGMLGAWMAAVCGLGDILDREKVKSHLKSVFCYNFRPSLREHANPQRSGYALGDEGGLLLCSWPRGGKPALPFVYSDEVWTGIEYQAASHLILLGEEEMGSKIVRACRARYDGEVRNPFDEYECGHWYARAMASYALLEAYSGVRYDAEEKTLYYRGGRDVSVLLAWDGGYGLTGVKDGKPFVSPVRGQIAIDRMEEWK